MMNRSTTRMPVHRVIKLALIAVLSIFPVSAIAQPAYSSAHIDSIDAIPAEYLDLSQRLYIAYFGRPADSNGLIFWAGQLHENHSDLLDVGASFGNSPEFHSRYFGLSDEALVNGLYQQLFGRDADPGGLEHYVGRLQSGDPEWTLASIALRILNGIRAGSVDEEVVRNRVLFSQVFTAVVPAPDSRTNRPYSGPEAINVARELLMTVTDNPVTVALALMPVFRDRDSDGVLDAFDPDVDGDGVLNVNDRCAYSSPGSTVDEQGC